MVENGNTSGPQAETIVGASLKPMLDAGADMIVLGCTHYPFLTETIDKVARQTVPGREITIIDPAPAVAKHLTEVMKQEGISMQSPDGYSIELHSSGDPENLERTFRLIL